MPTFERVWVPPPHCTVTSGDCFQLSRCLGNCSVPRKKDHERRIKELEQRLEALEIALRCRLADANILR